MDDNRTIIKAFTDMAPKYEQVVDNELKNFWGWSYNNFVDNLLELTPIHDEDIILDVATGTAVIPLKLTKRGGRIHQIIGLDITFAMLEMAKAKINRNGLVEVINLTCASAMKMPFCSGAFNVILCGLATHHMDVPLLLSEMKRLLKPGGSFTIADAGGSPAWRLPVINLLIRMATFIYFLITQSLPRAYAEAKALYNVRTMDEWYDLLSSTGFTGITVNKLASKYSWLPNPLIIRATTQKQETKYDHRS
jgi:ubiquinone/menaquinone biosynthesis C-methylase UbiE